jgi:hypothetical protein
VRVLRGDISQFDDLMGVITAVKPDRVINFAYYISSDLPEPILRRSTITKVFGAASGVGPIDPRGGSSRRQKPVSRRPPLLR